MTTDKGVLQVRTSQSLRGRISYKIINNNCKISMSNESLLMECDAMNFTLFSLKKKIILVEQFLTVPNNSEHVQQS